jgi:tRNA1Val (adenine37-N6)-methyltransferase
VSSFQFRRFRVDQDNSAMKVGTDALLLGAMVSFSGAQEVLEIGAGTGVISLMLAQRDPNIRITAVEIDGLSAEDCQSNFLHSEWNERLTLIQGDFLTTNFEQTFDLIVSNPPFYSDSLQNIDHRKARSRHEAHLPFDKLIDKCAELLSPVGCLWVVIPITAHQRVIELCGERSLFLKTDCSVNGKPGNPVRSILSFSKKRTDSTKKTVFTIRDTAGNFSTEYKVLTAEFHDREL